MKKRIFITIILIMLFTTITIALSFSSKSDDTKQGSEMAIMVQNENNNTQYDEWESETWPDGNQYQLNTTKSKCNNTENVAEFLSYNNNNVSINTNKTYRCNLFFDKKKDEPLSITNIEVDTSKKNTVKLTINAKGGDGNYTYDVENTCECGGIQNKCGKDSSDSIISKNDNVITIYNLNYCYTHNFKIIVKDESGHVINEEKKGITVTGISLGYPCACGVKPSID